jgi:putative SOS response-associated peptidase YedK
MCGRFSLNAGVEEILAAFRIFIEDKDQVIPLLYAYASQENIFPLGTALAIRKQTDARTISPMKWGFVPGTIKNEKDAAKFVRQYSTFNARSETFYKKKTFQGALLQNQFCLIPVTGFYEPVVKSGKKTGEQAFFSINEDRIFSLAGLWKVWGDERQFTILTKEPNEIIGQYHHRSPIILGPDTGDELLDSEFDFSQQDGIERFHELIARKPAAQLNVVLFPPLSKKTQASKSGEPDMLDDIF